MACREAIPEDIDYLLHRLQEGSRVPSKFALDTSTATVEETLAEFVEKVEPIFERLRPSPNAASRDGEQGQLARLVT